MKKFIIPFLLLSTPVSAQQINADRPGVGSDADVVPYKTLQIESGTDSYEIRAGILPNTEIMKDNTSFGIKYAMISNNQLVLGPKLSYDVHDGFYGEFPIKYTINKYFGLGGDVILSKSSRIFVSEYNLSPNDQITISPSLYYDTKLRSGISLTWIPKQYQNIQLDTSYFQNKINIGISVALNFLK